MSRISLVSSKVKTLNADVTVTGAAVSGDQLQIAGTHAYEVGDIVSISGIVGAVEANIVGVVASISTTVSFKLEQLMAGITAYVSGGISKHIGWASPLVSTDNTVIDNTADLTLRARLEALSAGTVCRLDIEDFFGALQTAETVATFNASGAMKNNIADEMFCKRLYELPGLRIGNTGNFLRSKILFPAGVPGNAGTFSSWLEA